MRKLAVVVTVAISAMLAGGVMIAVTAGDADEVSPAPATAQPAIPHRPAVGPGTQAGERAATQAGERAATQAGERAATQAGERAATQAEDRAAKKDAERTTKRPRGKAAIKLLNRKKTTRSTRRAEPSTRAAAHRHPTRRHALSTIPRGSVQQQVLRMINQSRRRGGCRNLTVDRRLSLAANRHAADMARRGYFAHRDSRGARAGDRVRDAGYRWSQYGENIARGQGSAGEVVRGWMNSPAHRRNILDCRLREVGVGLAFGSGRTPYWVQDFATPQ